MAPYLLIDIEIINTDDGPGEMNISKDYLELILRCLKRTGWDQGFFTFFHVGEYDDDFLKNSLSNSRLNDFNDIVELASGKKTIYLFSRFLIDNPETHPRDYLLELNISNDRLTFKFPHFIISNAGSSHIIFNRDFNPIKEFGMMIDNILDAIAGSNKYFLRRANIHVFGIEFRKFRPSFDTFFIAESSVYEVYHINRFSTGYSMPEYVEKLMKFEGFPGIKSEKKGNYLFFQWIKPDHSFSDYHAQGLQDILFKRHVFLSTSGLIPQNSSFNEYGDIELRHMIPFKPENPVILNNDSAFIEPDITEKNVYSIETRKSLLDKIEEIKSDKKIKTINLIVENRNIALLLFNQSFFCINNLTYDFDRKIDTIFYRDEKKRLWHTPSGKWINNQTGVMLSIPASELDVSISYNIDRSLNYLTIHSYSIITCFKKNGNLFNPVWMVWDCMAAHVDYIDEEKGIVHAREGFMDLVPFEIELSSGKILCYGENPSMQSMKLKELDN